eukprot:CAMPEP_0204588592 /NCGR_PEP_ID=MMETSP0661-20131031/48704_1 /ASSEMBLY_ACC=CAM_ASM_000606 /TAXON_ID=109239 /ORGANISM="Alexandrium margalefi, Strain AMGDE01CS-322" /LENGTH=335 /DNA_ID=CAMNT_0051598411 /DNA_START=40 /DNA_END=1047 /DNA_ORIENTATION=-
MKRVCGASSRDILAGDASAALMDRVLRIFEPRPRHQDSDGEHDEDDLDDEVREQKHWKKQSKGTRGGRDQHRSKVLQSRVASEGQADSELASSSTTPVSSPQDRRGGAPAGETARESARELFGSLQTFKALLEKQGDKGDPALREKLGEVSEQLAAEFLDSGIKDASRVKAPSTPSSSSCCSSARAQGESGTVKLHMNASMLKGSVGSFRDAQVDFEERQVVVRAIDRGGRTWTLRSAKLPGPILADESRFQLGKTGKDLSITLKKADVNDIWRPDQLKFSEEKSWCVSTTGPDEAASSSGGKAASDPGTSSRHLKKDIQPAPTPDYIKLGHAFI